MHNKTKTNTTVKIQKKTINRLVVTRSWLYHLSINFRINFVARYVIKIARSFTTHHEGMSSKCCSAGPIVRYRRQWHLPPISCSEFIL